MTPKNPSQTKKLFRIYLGTVSALFLISLVVWQTAGLLPHSKMIRGFFLDENSLIEGVALSFLLSALAVTLYALLRTRKNTRYSPYWWLFPTGIFLLISDETSFGRMYYNWYSPLNICGVKFDALHDALMVVPHCLPHFGISKIVFVTAVLISIILASILASRLILKNKVAFLLSLKSNPVWLYLAFAFVLFCLGGGLEFISEIDFFAIEKFSFLVFLEEVLETLAEYTMLFAAIAFFQRK